MTIPTDIRAALIDMDGILYDSMPGHARAWRRVMASIGLDIPEAEFFQYEGCTGAWTINHLIERELGRPASETEKRDLYALKAKFFMEQGQAAVMPGAQKLIGALLDRGVTTVLVTGSGQNSLLSRLDTDFPGAFPPERRVTSDSVTHGKPHPEPYLRGLALAGTDAADTIVIDNAPLGVKSGNAAGIFTVGVTTGPLPRRSLEENGADLIYNSMEECAESLSRLLR